MEREYIRDRTLEGHESARKRGKTFGGAGVTDDMPSVAPPSPLRPASGLGLRGRYLENAQVTRPRIRVAAYVIRHRAVPELLVFDHVDMPQAGTQIPAGGVHPDEELHQAVLREVVEETGLLTATVIRPITVEDKPHPDTRQPRRTTYFHLQAPATTADAWHHTVGGAGDDAGLTFFCRFVPLPLERSLTDDQDAWLGHLDPRWATPATLS
ncbi:NUDIX hydrolase [Actinoallomurus soli]|uniref:NUDIX hydrolase n=1 Tax=Actinoallomurus soli TaxID=2952535 RepID=UPI00209372AB|nr:NUDIX domain-containing protein [Actinoallomurus soli]MCO5972442.1 NUDIX domain-containing protein [Actinoallomurus soli]